MSGLIEKAGGREDPTQGVIEKARLAWEESMLRQVDRLREQLRAQDLARLAIVSGSEHIAGGLRLIYWQAPIRLAWPEVEASHIDTGEPLSLFDSAMLCYYLTSADGHPLAERWVGFRDLADGAFYHLSFQRYSGDRLAAALGERPEDLDRAGRAWGGWPVPSLGQYAFAFAPLPRIHLAAVIWPGDEEFPSRGSVLFNAHARHYMPIDGLALLGGGLAGRLAKSAG
jgi:hypothetical protein